MHQPELRALLCEVKSPGLLLAAHWAIIVPFWYHVTKKIHLIDDLGALGTGLLVQGALGIRAL